MILRAHVRLAIVYVCADFGFRRFMGGEGFTWCFGTSNQKASFVFT